MNYIIFDLEFNQQHPDDIKDDNKPELLFEIIQIGALKLDSKFNTISTFNYLIKPNIHTKIHPYVENLTKITEDELNKALDFKNVYNEFLKFIGNTDSVLVVWGTSDIQSYATKLFKLPKGQKIGLKKAVEVLEIAVDGEFHDAFFDAHYTSEVFKSIYNKKIIPQVYNKTLEKRPKVKKEKLDSKALINEFEKIYNRKMSKEEIQIIRLAYFMGKTKQFIIKDE